MPFALTHKIIHHQRVLIVWAIACVKYHELIPYGSTFECVTVVGHSEFGAKWMDFNHIDFSYRVLPAFIPATTTPRIEFGGQANG